MLSKNQLTRQQIGITGLNHGHATQHLANNNLNVLVVDFHPRDLYTP